MPAWLYRPTPIGFPLFISHRRLQRQKTWKPANTTWCLDSGGFTELNLFGRWTTSATDYVAAIRRYIDEIGMLNWAAPQDAMCEPWILEKSKDWLGGTVEAHQRWTVDNFLHLSTIAADINFIPVVQGWKSDDYMRHIDMYDKAGIDLTKYHTVGVGSVCRREHTLEIGTLFERLAAQNLRMHGFGVKTRGLAQYWHHLVSADSMAWCLSGSRSRPCPHTGAATCANCIHFAIDWRDNVLCQLIQPSALQLAIDI